MRIWEVRELKFHWTFFLFPVNPTFFLCVFRSGRSFSFHIGLKGQCLEFAGFCGKNTSQRMSQGRFFRQTWKGLTLQTREEHVTTFAYWNDKNDLPAGGLLNEEDLQVGKQGKSSCSPFSPLGNCLCGRKNKCVGSSPSDTLVRVSKGSFHERQSAMPCTAGVSGNVALEKDIKIR